MGLIQSITTDPEGCGKTKREALEALEHYIMFHDNSQKLRSSNGRPYIVANGKNFWVKYESKQRDYSVPYFPAYQGGKVEYHTKKITMWRAYVNYE
jgi:hypothetical protein